MPDAVVIGAGPNGLVAANLLADAGWEVLVLEEQEQPGGAVKSGELTEAGFVSDLFSAFYPLAAAPSPMRELRLEEHGLRWRRSRVAVAHPAADGTCPVLSTDLDETAASLDAFAPGDGDAWRRLYELWLRVGEDVMAMLTGAFPPLRPAAGLARELGPHGTLRLARMAVLGVRRHSEETFRGAGGGRLLAGNALHADLAPELPPSAFYGWVLASLGQQVGFPVPEGGAGRLIEALVRRLRAHGGEVRCGQRVEAIAVRSGRAAGVRLAGGEDVAARRAVLADVDAPQLYRQLLPAEAVPSRVRADLEGFQFDSATVKVDWSLDGPIPWAVPAARHAGTIHVADDMDHLTRHSAELAMHLIPARPFLVLGQYAPVDETRMPPGKEVAWAYTHVPQRCLGDAAGQLSGRWDRGEVDTFAERIEAEVERLAPGFRSLIRRRHVFAPHELQAANRNLVNGALNGGTSQIHQQLVFRPTLGWGRPETPVKRLYLCSSAIHPGGGVHGAPGASGARAALGWDRARRGAAVAVPAGLGAAALAAGLRRTRAGSRD
ncbi:MAG TPA: NAD(P)/FAD-dependent oxidoreductase [Solirubrobacterales bacterium]|nr:NAD(P)/FAD-dependent oxidoreductase [Solirubrobacterales bacterium]